MTDYNERNISKESFEFVQMNNSIHDLEFDTKPIGYLKDAWLRFKKNKASIFAACVILFLICFAIFVPLFSRYDVSFSDGYYKHCVPKNELLAKIGIADGTYKKKVPEHGYQNLVAIGYAASDPTGEKKFSFTDSNGEHLGVGANYSPVREIKSEYFIEENNEKAKYYSLQIDSYYEVGFIYKEITIEHYEELLAYEEETGIKILYPLIEKSESYEEDNANYWYKTDNRGRPKLDKNGYIQDIYKRNSKGEPVYRKVLQSGQMVEVRMLYYEYFIYNNGFEPAFIFGTDSLGYDICVRLASGARLSLLLAVCVSAINLLIGAVYGAIEGYYGGTTDLIMERISDILNGIPFMIVATLFQLHLAKKVGAIPSLLFAFVLTGWLGTAYRVRTQFYRFKGQEYVLAARTLGAKDSRIMFRHIFPNALGTIITSSVLVIPGVIFSESMLSYLGIINLGGVTQTSIGTMLSSGQKFLRQFPHEILFPALVVSLLMICFNLFGNGLRDAFNPSLRGADE